MIALFEFDYITTRHPYEGASFFCFLAWGAVAVIFMLYATDNFTLQEPNLRFTLVGTAFFVVGLLGTVTRFKTAISDE